MTGACDIVRMANTGPGFYPLLGPYLASRQVAADLGEQPWDDPGKTWWVMAPGGAVAGFAAAADLGTHLAWCSAWTAPAWRGKGVWSALAAGRDTAAAGREVRVLCRPVLEAAYLRMGFTVTGRTAGYARMRRQSLAG